MRKKLLLLGLLSVFALTTIEKVNNVVKVEAIDLKDVMEGHLYNDEKISTNALPYRIYVPSTYDESKEYKLLFMLHGAGEKGNDNLAPINFQTGMVYANRIIKNAKYRDEFIILVPQCPMSDFWVDYTLGARVDLKTREQTTASKMAASLLFDTINNYNIDMSSIYITGLSMGGFATWDFVCRYPGLFAAAIPMCGGCDPNYYKEASLTPIWSFHCSDDGVVNYEPNKEMVENLRSIGAGILYTEYSGLGHNSWIPGCQNENAFYWMINQKRKNVYYHSTKTNVAASVKNVATSGTPLVSYIDPQWGIGNKNPNTIADGRAVFDQEEFNNSKDSFSYLQCDTYGLNKPNDVYFGYEFSEEYEFSSVYFQAGRYFPNGGGWFANGVKVQALINDEWVDIALTNDPKYPNVAVGAMIDLSTYSDFEYYEFKFDPILAKGIRLFGEAGGPQYFSSCAELEVYGKKNIEYESQGEINITSPSNEYSDEYILDKIKGAQVGQMVGVVYGAPTEFAYKGTLIPDDNIPAIETININDAFAQDDLYVEIPFIDALTKEGLDVSIEKIGEYFGETTFPLWHGNDVARTNINNGIKAPDSGSYQYSGCCEDIDWQIEADFVGMLNPGLVNKASNMGFDLGHVVGYADGAYGGSYVSAMHAKAFTAENILSIIITGIESLPKGSKYRSLLDDVLKWYCDDVSFEDCFAKLNQKYEDDDRCPREGFGGSAPFNIDAKLNGGYCLMGLLYGENDMLETMRLSMKCGQDSDCNPSTVGSILGNFYGYNELDPVFKKNIDFANNKFSYTKYTLNDVIDKIFELAKLSVGEGYSNNKWTIANDEQIVPLRLEVWEPMPSIDYTFFNSNKNVKIGITPYYDKGIKSVSTDFGDGTILTGQNVEHHYSKVGDYTITISVTGNDDTVARRVIKTSVAIDDNIAGKGTPIVSITNPTGSGSRNIEVIIDGMTGNSSSQQYDTYNSETAPAHEDYFGVTFTETQKIYKIGFVAGGHFNNGGWFENIRAQALIGSTWTDLVLTNDPGYPCATSLAEAGKEFASYVFEFNPIDCLGVRIIGQAGGSAHFTSCSEFKAYAIANLAFEEDEVSYRKSQTEITISFNNVVDGVQSVKLNNRVLQENEFRLDEDSIVLSTSLLEKENTLVVEFASNQASCRIVYENASEGFEIDAQNVKKQYSLGEQLDLSNLVVNEVFDDQSKTPLSSDKYQVETNFDARIAGNYTVTIKYKEYQSISFNVEVISKYITSIEILSNPYKSFYIGDEISFEQLIVVANYSNGEALVIKDYEIDKSALENEKGKYSIIVKYQTFTTSFNIEMLEKETKKKGCKSSVSFTSLVGLFTLFGSLFVKKKNN